MPPGTYARTSTTCNPKPWINFAFRSTTAFSSHLSRDFLKTREKVAVCSDL